MEALVSSSSHRLRSEREANLLNSAGQPDTYHNLTSSEKAVFMTHFHAISENLEETDRYLATYLAATRNTAFVEYVVSMVR